MFIHEDKNIHFIEARGKDISFERWRVTLYYHPNLALTHFLPSKEAYDAFLADNLPQTWQDYDAWKRSWWKYPNRGI